MLFGMCHQPSVVVNKQIKKGKWTQDVVSIIRKIRKYKIIKSSLRLDMMRLMWFWLTSWHHNIIHNKILISVLLLCSDDASGRYSAELLQYRVAQSNIPLNKRRKHILIAHIRIDCLRQNLFLSALSSESGWYLYFKEIHYS